MLQTNKMFIRTTLFILISLVHFNDSANILCIFNMASVSHQIVYQPIWKELSLRGHKVTVITPNPLNDPSLKNLTEIDIGRPLYKRVKDLNKKFSSKPSHWILNPLFLYKYVDSMKIIFSNPQVAELINNSTETFDVVLAEYAIPIGSAFAVKFNCPLVGVVSTRLTNLLQEQIGVPNHPVLYGEPLAPYGTNPSFVGRVKAVLNDIFLRLFYHYVAVPRFDKVIKKHFGSYFPYYGDIERNVSVVLMNSNPIIHGARPLGPNVIELGRLHIKRDARLPQDLQDFLDDATEGVIYFSLGSNVISAMLNEDKRNAIIKTFSDLPYKVLWKFEEGNNKVQISQNVMIKEWFPQQAVLNHPNLKLFITQGGLQSTEEALVAKVPLLVIPFIFDQHYNAKRIAELGIGRMLYFEDLSEESIKSNVIELMTNSSYREAIAEVSEAVTDEPISGLEKAVFWVEYVIKHKGAKYLTSPLKDIPWLKFLLLDVVTVLILACLVLFFILYQITVSFIRLCFRKQTATKLKTR